MAQSAAPVNGPVKATNAAAWALEHGRNAFATEDLAQLLRIPNDQVRRRLNAPARRGEWASPSPGLWLPVPPEYRTWGAPPAVEIVDRLMTHLGTSYYVGWLSAASIHGAAHQAPQVFQVATSRYIRPRTVGRSRFQFFERSNVDVIPTINHPTRAGKSRISTLEGTALDIATDVSGVGGIDNAATVIIDLAEHPDFHLNDVVRLAALHPAASARRIGWILENFAETTDVGQLRKKALDGPASASRLDPTRPAHGRIDTRWNIHINREIEPDL